MFDINNKKRIVIKVGTSTLTHKTGRLNIRRMERFVKTLADIQNSGHEIILVSSGAIGLGMAKLGLESRPSDTPMKQACAAVGQCELMYIYDKLFGEYNVNVAQILLTKYVLESPRKNNVENAFQKLIDHNVIPIVNENDTVAIDELELEFGENDSLAAHVGIFCHADMLIILSDIDGFFDGDPRSNPDAKLIPVIVKLSGIDGGKKVNQISRKERITLMQLLKDLTVTVKDFRPIDEAIVTGGGVCISEINPKTMESKLVKGLYFAGEVIDVDAYTGGFNLQIAFSTGHAAGMAM